MKEERYKLTEDFAGKKKGDEILLKIVKDKSYSEWKYKGCGVILTKDSQIIKKVHNIFEIVDNIDDIYKELGRSKPTIKNYTHLPESKRERALNLQYIDDIYELFNDGWIIDWNNSNQYKYYPYFRKNGSGWSLGGVGAVSVSFGSAVGSGFYGKNKEIVNFIVSKFLDIYIKTLN